jgi:AcrR family transcriptional regulator
MRNSKMNALRPLKPAAPRRAPAAAFRSTRRERRRNEIRERIFSAALRLFAEHGYLETTVENITEAADVGKGTFFNYFPTKEHVLATYGEERVATMERALEKARAGKGSVLAILKEIATSLAGQSSASPELLRSIFAAHLTSATVRADLQKRMLRARGLMTQIFTLAQDRGEIRRDRSAASLARMTHIIFMGVTIAWAVNPDSSLQKAAEEVWDSVCPSLRAEKARKERKRP